MEWYKRIYGDFDSKVISNLSFFPTQNVIDCGLSEIRCEKAYAAAEAHYLKDLPLQYPLAYHKARIASAYNTFLKHARGDSVVPQLQSLTLHLTRLYLSDRITCSALLTSGSQCQREPHYTPPRFPGISTAISLLKSKLNISADATAAGQKNEEHNDHCLLMEHLKLFLTEFSTSGSSLVPVDEVLRECLRDVPPGNPLMTINICLHVYWHSLVSQVENWL